MVSFNKERLKVKVFITSIMVDWRDSGLMMLSSILDKKFGMMELGMRVIIKMV